MRKSEIVSYFERYIKTKAVRMTKTHRVLLFSVRRVDFLSICSPTCMSGIAVDLIKHPIFFDEIAEHKRFRHRLRPPHTLSLACRKNRVCCPQQREGGRSRAPRTPAAHRRCAAVRIPTPWGYACGRRLRVRCKPPRFWAAVKQRNRSSSSSPKSLWIAPVSSAPAVRRLIL